MASKESIVKENMLLKYIHEMQLSFFDKDMEFGWCDEIMSNLLTLSDSEYGFICELLYYEDGAPYLRSQATCSHKKWDAKTQDFFDKGRLKTLEFNNLHSLWGAVITSGEAVIANDPDNDPRRSGYPKGHGHPPLNSFLGLPIFDTSKNMIGVMGVANKKGGYNGSEVDFLDVFTSTYGVLLEKSRLQKKQEKILQELNDARKLAEELAITDELTGLFNRRHFNLIAENELKRNRRESSSFTLCMLDIDYFKKYNDTYGHQAGDEALRQVSEALKNTLRRPTDYAFRIGGEEFCFLFSGLSMDASRRLAEHVRMNVEALKIPHSNNIASPYVSVSIGVVEIDVCSDLLSLDSVYSSVDKALYKAKEAGRNCVVTEALSL